MNETKHPVTELTTADSWDEKWSEIFNHYQKDTRHAYYIDAVRCRKEKRILEIAAGSFRDISRLNKSGVEGYGVDFSAEAVALAKEYYPHIAEHFKTMDAFNLDYPDKVFDLTYHNGFWVLFDDESILKLAREQARVTQRRMIATVHNAHNTSFKEYFERQAAVDPLFNIRFFEHDEISELMGSVCSRVTVIPVGKAKKSYEDWLIRKGLGHPALLRACFNLSGQRLLNTSERLLCIGEL